MVRTGVVVLMNGVEDAPPRLSHATWTAPLLKTADIVASEERVRIVRVRKR